MQGEIVIVGSGMAGLACAHRLAAAGLSPQILDKGRGLGGRMATRRGAAGRQYDHGAQYFTVRDPSFRRVVAQASAARAVAAWPEAGDGRYVGLPGMSGLPRFLARALNVRQAVTVTGLARAGARWRLETSEGPLSADRVILTPPAPQTADLLEHAAPDLAAAAQGCRFEPCLTLMMDATPHVPNRFVTDRDTDGPLAWLAHDSSKPGRPAGRAWIAQAGPGWSRTHLEETVEHIVEAMLPALCDRLRVDPGDVLHAAAHRWRYARVSKPLGAPFLRLPDGTLYAGGDWCIGPRVEAAWQSGTAIAEDLLGDGPGRAPEDGPSAAPGGEENR
ncbi:MAG: FAD-dependent oxidoreductase [Pseudomonadota bacterium]